MSVDDRLAELHIVIPESTAPVANYVTARRTGDLLFLSGHLGKRDGAVVVGRVGDDVDTDTAYDLARHAAIDLLGTARAALGTLETVAVVKLTGFVQSGPAFTEQSAVINGAADESSRRSSRAPKSCAPRAADVIDLRCLPDTPFPISKTRFENSRQGISPSASIRRSRRIAARAAAGADYLLSLTERILKSPEEPGTTGVDPRRP